MIKLTEVNHHIQKHILSVLQRQKFARFRDLRPPRVDTNLYSYHLKLLQKNDMVQKTDGGYQLGARGLTYIDRVSSEKFTIRTQPKIITMLVLQNSDGDVLLQRRDKQPYIDTWTLPYGKLHIDDTSINVAAQREALEKLDLHDPSITHAGDCYIRVTSGGEIISTTLAHVFYGETNDIEMNDRLIWARPHKLETYDLAPAVEQIVTRTFFRDPYFFEEYTKSFA